MELNTDMVLNAIRAITGGAAAELKAAEKYLDEVSGSPMYPVLLMQVCAQSNDDVLKLGASLLFKRYVERNWKPGPDKKEISPELRAKIRAELVSLMLVSSEHVQWQLSEAVNQIAEIDFPHLWANLLGELLGFMDVKNLKQVEGSLRTLESLARRYELSQANSELQWVLDTVEKPLRELLGYLYQRLTVAGADVHEQVRVVKCADLIAQIFYFLNCPEMFAVVEDHLKEWMGLFHSILVFQTNREELISDDEDEPGLIHHLHVSVFAVLNLFLEKYSTEFESYIRTFVQEVWDLLSRCTLDAKYDRVVASAMQFLTIVARGEKFVLLQDNAILERFTDSIIFPNLTLRPFDMNLFEDYPEEYVKRDIAGSDEETRRRAAVELIRALRFRFEAQISEIIQLRANAFLHQYETDRSKWHLKDAALFALYALAINFHTERSGATRLNPHVDILALFQKAIVPELENPSHPILLADSLKFTTQFRQYLPSDVIGLLAPVCARNLAHESYVVQCYSAECLDRYMQLTESHSSATSTTTTSSSTEGPHPPHPTQPAGSTMRAKYGPSHLRPVIETLLTNGFAVIRKGSHSQPENEYVMKLLMRVFVVMGAELKPVLDSILDSLKQVLARLHTQGASNPQFTHSLFESLGYLIKLIAIPNTDQVPLFETHLFPVFGIMLKEDRSEFVPYVFQIFAQLLWIRSGPPSAMYDSVAPALLMASLWSNLSYVPGLNALLQAYLAKCPEKLLADNGLLKVLGVFQFLISHSKTDHNGFSLLYALFHSIPYESVAPHLPQLLQLVYGRMMELRNNLKFARGLILMVATVCTAYGPGRFLEATEGLRRGLTRELSSFVILPNLNQILNREQRKVCALGFIKLIHYDGFLRDYADLWAQFIMPILSLITAVADSTVGLEDVEDSAAALEVSTQEYRLRSLPMPSAFSREALSADTAVFFATSVGALLRTRPELAASLPPDQSSTLNSFLHVHLMNN